MDLYLRADQTIELGALELEGMVDRGEIEPVKPYWDVVLRRDRRTRIDLLQRLVRLGLAGFRRRAKGFVGLFCVRKKHDQQRLIIDGRYASQCCRRPPASKLGTSATIGDLDLSDSTLRAAGLEDPWCTPRRST